MSDLTSFTLYQADCVGREKNTKYPHLIRVSCANDLQKALSRDCVCARYRDSHRSNEDFIESDCLGMDIDNSHTGNSADWVTPEDVHKLIPDVTMGVHYSRHHMKQKEGASPRPRFHVFFLCDRETNAAKYRHLKERMQEILPFFDPKAMDAARFFYGSSDPVCDFIPGTITLNECLDMYYPEDDPATDPLANMAVPDYMSVPIHEGSRNATMSHFAGKLLKRLGPTEEAEAVFHQRAQACVPPLPEEELAGIWRSALGFYRRISKEEGYIQPAAFSAQQNGGWEDPLPFSKATCLPFPIDALPGPFAEYASAVSESTQTPIDLAGTAALSIMATCLQGKYRIAGKPDWVEPLNLYVLGIALPSERKSAVLSAMLRPVNDYETSQNQMNAATLESNRMRRRVLERRQKAIEEMVSKGKAEPSELDKIAEEITSFHEEKPLRLYVDDITPEKLVAVLAENDGRISLISSEGGIFDTLAGAYSKTVNIDVMLKGYSGDAIRVDRIGRESHSVLAPALNILLMAQPKVISDVLSNQNFRGRGLTARFLFCLPDSAVGHRRYRSQSVSEEARKRYDAAVFNLLSDEYLKPPELITLTPEADRMLESFANEIESEITRRYVEISDWVGKLVGNTLRIAGLLCRASIHRSHDFLTAQEPLRVDAAIMGNAIRIGRYFLSHVQNVFNVLPENAMTEKAEKILLAINERKLKAFNRRDAMRMCRTFKTVADIQPVLDFLEDYGYIRRAETAVFQPTGRPPCQSYHVHPNLEGMVLASQARPASSGQ